ncbi:MAG: hypothetical protein ABGY75_20900, partial [Gemmataceae bacterium]
RPPAWLQMYSSDGLRGELEGAGFQNVSVIPVAHQWNVSSAQWFIENFDASQAFCARLGPGSRDRLREAVLAELRAEHGDGPFALAAHAHIATATK